MSDVKQLPLDSTGTAAEYPSWYTPSKYRKTGNARALRGQHPTGFELGREETTCGTCGNCYRNWGGRRSYFKCELIQATRGPGTDIRVKWRGCERWRERPPDETVGELPPDEDTRPLGPLDYKRIAFAGMRTIRPANAKPVERQFRDPFTWPHWASTLLPRVWAGYVARGLLTREEISMHPHFARNGELDPNLGPFRYKGGQPAWDLLATVTPCHECGCADCKTLFLDEGAFAIGCPRCGGMFGPEVWFNAWMKKEMS